MLFYFLLVLSVGSAFAHVCDFCNCEPSRENVFSISCGCNVTKDLHFTEAIMKGVESTEMVLIKNCDSVDVDKNSFSKLHQLETLHVQNCQKLHLRPGAFSNLTSLLVNNVKDVSLDEMALMGARGIKKIVVSSSHIAKLPKYSLYDVKDLNIFKFVNVTVEKIAKDAFNISAKNISIENSLIKYVEDNAIVLSAKTILFKNSTFLITYAGAMDLQTEFHTRFLDNHFNTILQINITSPFVEFARNEFSSFNATNLYNVQRALFMNNSILESEVGFLLSQYSEQYFHDNKFECHCGMNLMNRTRHSKNYEILKQNYCIVRQCEYSLFEFEYNLFDRCARNLEVNIVDACLVKIIKARQEAEKPRRAKNEKSQRDNNESTVSIMSRFLPMEGNNTEESTDQEQNESSNTQKLFAQVWLLVSVAMFSVWR